MGIAMTNEEKDSIQHMWRYGAYLLGVDERLLCTNFQEESKLYKAVVDHTRYPNEDSYLLTMAAVHAVSNQPYLLFAPVLSIS